jgi:hypothetical protein
MTDRWLVALKGSESEFLKYKVHAAGEGFDCWSA